jgi:hypothetical protein
MEAWANTPVLGLHVSLPVSNEYAPEWSHVDYQRRPEISPFLPRCSDRRMASTSKSCSAIVGCLDFSNTNEDGLRTAKWLTVLYSAR